MGWFAVVGGGGGGGVGWFVVVGGDCEMRRCRLLQRAQLGDLGSNVSAWRGELTTRTRGACTHSKCKNTLRSFFESASNDFRKAKSSEFTSYCISAVDGFIHRTSLGQHGSQKKSFPGLAHDPFSLPRSSH
jgi:hypothetical protein